MLLVAVRRVGLDEVALAVGADAEVGDGRDAGPSRAGSSCRTAPSTGGTRRPRGLSPPGSTAAARSNVGVSMSVQLDRSAATIERGSTDRAVIRDGRSAPSLPRRRRGSRRIAVPETRPAGRRCGVPPSTVQVSPGRGVNGTVTRRPGVNVIRSSAWLTASS